MQVSSHTDTPITSGGQLITSVGINGSHTSNQVAYANAPKQLILENVDPASLEEEDSDSDGADGAFVSQVHQQMQLTPGMQNMAPVLAGPKPGKKTKGRVKIKMEFIENKLRRYTTFSKRKTGIMKKAYELSTLTGTQVMLLVASETGHVYTFATRKLQPMITSESGKALIQTCLNSPDPPPFSPGQQQAVEQRMNPSGFEETELTCTVGEEDSKAGIQVIQEGLAKQPMYQVSSGVVQADQSTFQTSQPTAVSSQSVQLATTQPTVTSYVQQANTGHTVTVSQAPPSSKAATATAAATNISMQIPAGLILPGTPITIPIQQGHQAVVTTQQQQQQQHHQTVYRIPSSQLVSVASSQLNTSSSDTSQSPVSSVSSTPSNITMVSADGLLPGSASMSGNAMTPGIVMYQTPQGVVYATPTATLQDRGTIFNFQQPATAISMQQQDQQVGSGTQQIITIPVPVSLANSGQVFHLTTAHQEAVEVAPPPVKKTRK
ncbi:serum response factor-like [Haliotis rubra]|uniref:serum response factor-like n=1 Tax=Haliotis rubra TaxID=36100 RepID=UPI001EE53D45|nr:serum response factor-like [Haliotis rubra]